MRMNYKKRLWPMLALLPVFALVAALSFGLVGPNPPAAEAQTVPAAATATGDECAFTIEHSIAAGVTLPTAATISGGPCKTAGNSVTVAIINEDTTLTAGDDSVDIAVYVTGGSEFSALQAMSASNPIGKVGIDELELRLGVPRTFGEATNKATITVTRSMAGKGDVYLLLYEPTDPASPPGTGAIPISRTTPALSTASPIYAIKVEFTGPPVLMLTGSTDNDASTLEVMDAMNATSGQEEVVLDATTGETPVTLTLKDANGKPVTGAATLEVGGGSDVQFVGSNLKTRVISVGATGVATDMIRGLPRTGALRIPLDATVGTLELPTYYITRAGDEAASVSVNAYVCTFDSSDGAEDEENVDECMDEKEALGNTNTGDDPDALTVVAPGSFILLAGNAADAVGNKSLALNLKWTASDASVLNVSSAEDQPFAGGTTANALDFAHIQIADNATLGEYTIMVEDVGEDVTPAASVTFTVTGDASQLRISGPDIIDPATGLATYTVTATDRNGNIPTDVLDNPATTAPNDGIRVSVIVRAEGNPTVTGLKADGNLDFASNGEATFTIVMPYGTRLGSRVNIVVSGGSLNATKESTYGAVAPALGPATGLTATSNTAGTVMLSWTAGPGSTRHYMAGIRKSELDAGNTDNVIFTAADSNSAHTVTGLTDGAVYLFTVISGNATRWSTWHDIIEVTVNPTAGGGGGPTNPFS